MINDILDFVSRALFTIATCLVAGFAILLAAGLAAVFLGVL